MEDLNNLTPEDLKRPEVLRELQEKVDFIVAYYDEEEAREVSRALKKLLKRQDLNLGSEILNKLNQWYNLASYLSLPAQLEEDVIFLFQNNLKDILGLDEDILLGRLETKLRIIPLGAEEEFAEKLIQALKDNRQEIGDLTLGQWAATLNHSYPNVPLLSEFEERDFLAKNERAQTLSTEDREKLTKLFKISNFLRPFELWAQYMKEGGGLEMTSTERKQIRLGEALEKVAGESPRLQGYQGPRDLRDIRPNHQGPRTQLAPKKLAPPPLPPRSQPISRPSFTTQEIKPPQGYKWRPPVSPAPKEEAAPSLPQDKPPQREESPQEDTIPKPKVLPGQGDGFKKESEASHLTIADLERIAASGNFSEEQKVRKIIQQDFNQLSPEVRRYVLNSPFWAE